MQFQISIMMPTSNPHLSLLCVASDASRIARMYGRQYLSLFIFKNRQTAEAATAEQQPKSKAEWRSR
jgi:hypothetical protein